MKLDFSKVRVVDKDDHTTTLKHYAGHEIKIIHSKLSNENKEALYALHKDHDERKAKREAKMAEGGEVSKVQYQRTATDKEKTEQNQNIKDFQQGATNAPAIPSDSPFKTGDWSRVWKAEGGEVSQADQDTAEKMRRVMTQANDRGENRVLRRDREDYGEQVRHYGQQLQRKLYADGGQVEGQPDDSAMAQALQGMPGSQMVNIPGMNPSQVPQAPPTMGQVIQDVGNILMSPSGSRQAEQPAWSKQAMQAQEPQFAPQAPPTMAQNMAPQPSVNPQDQDPMGMKAYLNTANEALGLQQQAAQKEFQAAQQMGAQKAAADLTYQAQMQRMQNQFNTDVEQNMNNITATIQDIKDSHINPRAYQESMSSGEKVMSAIGMIAGGLGQGFIGGPNPAAEFLNKQIDRDIRAQEFNINKKNTLLSAYQAQFRDKMAANQMSRATLNALYASKLDLAAHQAATPAAQANLLKVSGELKMKAADLTRQATLNEYMYGLGNVGGTGPGGAPSNAMERENAFRRQQSFLMMTNPELAKARAAAHVPGIGDAPIGTTIPDGAKHEFASHQKFDQAAQDLYNFVKQHKGSLNSLLPKDRAQAEAKAMVLQSLFREGTLGTVYREGEQPLLDKAIRGNPISLFGYFTELPKLEEIMKSNAHAENALRSVYGLPNREEPRPSAPQQGQVVIGKDGKQYVRQGAYMVPIK